MIRITTSIFMTHLNFDFQECSENIPKTITQEDELLQKNPFIIWVLVRP